MTINGAAPYGQAMLAATPPTVLEAWPSGPPGEWDVIAYWTTPAGCVRSHRAVATVASAGHRAALREVAAEFGATIDYFDGDTAALTVRSRS